jgi:hypothetical protein
MRNCNTICNPDDRVTYPVHKHRCERCGVTWKHDRDEAYASDAPHNCPSCGKKELSHYPSMWTEDVEYPMSRPLYVIAKEIRNDWSAQRADHRVPPFADAYLRPMETLNAITDNYHLDTARSIVLYFLSNAGTWKGEVARRIKAELKELLK